MDSITPTQIQVIAQGLSGLYPLTGDVAEAVASDTEYFVRQVIESARTFQSHCKEGSLSAAHVASALRLVTGRVPLGYGAKYPSQKLAFRAVAGAEGLYVHGDEVLSLVTLRETTLPEVAVVPPPLVSWLRPPSADEDRARARKRLLFEGTAYVPRDMVAVMAKRTDACLRAEGGDDVAIDAEALQRVLDGCLRLAAAPLPSVRALAHDVVRVVLSVLLAPQARDDETRLNAAPTLARVLCAFHDVTLVRTRVLSTLVRALTLPDAGLDVLYGAVLGLAACGTEACRTFLAPYLPRLHAVLADALATADAQTEEDGSRTRYLVSQIAETAAYACAEDEDGAPTSGS